MGKLETKLVDFVPYYGVYTFLKRNLSKTKDLTEKNFREYARISAYQGIITGLVWADSLYGLFKLLSK